MKKNLIAAAIIYLTWVVVFFIAVSFYYVTFDFSKWSADGRYMFSGFGIILGLIIFAAVFANSFTDNKS